MVAQQSCGTKIAMPAIGLPPCRGAKIGRDSNDFQCIVISLDRRLHVFHVRGCNRDQTKES
jgi:hypothetical protein